MPGAVRTAGTGGLMRLFTFLALAFTGALAVTTARAQDYLQGSTTMVSSCTGSYYDSGGPSAPHSNSEDSTITFCNPGTGAITLSFSAFNLESCCDRLTFHDGPTASSPMIGSYTGSAVPPPVSSTGSCLTAVFHSDGSVTYDGWSATISCGAIDTTSFRHGTMPLFETCEGTYYDSGGPSGQYTNGEMSTTTFCDPAGTGPIAMSFTSFVTESCCDHLTVHDGPDTTGIQLGMYSGSTSPGVLASSGACLTFAWRSDGSVLGDGWSATITCGAIGGENGAPCVTASSCDSGYCVDGVCCDSTCGSGATDDCQACSVSRGGTANGVCSPVSLCGVDAGPTERDAGTAGRDAGPRTDSGTFFPTDAGLRSRRAGRRGGCCAVAGTERATDPAGWLLSLAFLLVAVVRRRRR